MSKSKKPASSADKEATKASKRKTGILFVRIGQEFEDAIQAFQAAQRIPPDKSAVVLTALQEFLEREGFPPKKSPDA